jgi:hypothetical protein
MKQIEMKYFTASAQFIADLHFFVQHYSTNFLIINNNTKLVV